MLSSQNKNDDYVFHIVPTILSQQTIYTNMYAVDRINCAPPVVRDEMNKLASHVSLALFGLNKKRIYRFADAFRAHHFYFLFEYQI